MTVKIVIHTDNAAFEDDIARETARILMGLSARITGFRYFSPGHVLELHDVNGNDVGHLEFTE